MKMLLGIAIGVCVVGFLWVSGVTVEDVGSGDERRRPVTEIDRVTAHQARGACPLDRGKGRA